MRSFRLLSALFLLPAVSCSTDEGAEGSVVIERLEEDQFEQEVRQWDTSAFDNIHRTCALYVAIRSRAWEGSMAFGNDVEDSMVHWNLCPGGKMVACAPAPAAGDSSHVGIPWPYAEKSGS